MDADLLQQILTAFATESRELLDGLDQLVPSLRTAQGAELVAPSAAAMRLAHTLKGGANSVGLEAAGREAHSLEDLLAPIARGEKAPPADLAARVSAHLAKLHHLLDEGLKERAAVARHVGALDEADEKPAPVTPAAAHVTLRVESERLDQLMGLAGDLLSHRGRLGMHARHLDSFHEELAGLVAALPAEHRKDLAALTGSLGAFLRRDRQDNASLGRLAGELGSAVRRIRLVPLGSLAPAWRRATLEAAHALDKQVELRLELADVEVDKRVLDLIREPVTHLLRNCVSHGIEAASVRAAKGKPPQGRVVVRAVPDRAVVRLEICDDGAGFDLAAIGRAAVKAGRIDADALAHLAEDRVLELAFEPGVTTAERVTAVSGRGVGLDAVREAITALGGRVEPEARCALGGAGFRLVLPLDVLTTRVLLVREDNVTFGLPVTQIERTVRVRAGSVTAFDGLPMTRLEDGQPLHLRWLGTQREQSPDAWLMVVLLSLGSTRLGLVVGEVVAETELVVRPLPWNLKRLRGVQGAASLADGSVAVVLDATTLASVTRGARTGLTPSPRRVAKPRVLVVDDSLTHRTLEQTILVGAGYEVTVAADGLAGWRALEEGQFDLVVSDVEMPGLDGIGLTRRVRAHPRLRELPVVLVTGMDKRADVERGLEAGANEYVVKGQLEPEKLLQAVARNLWTGGSPHSRKGS